MQRFFVTARRMIPWNVITPDYAHDAFLSFIHFQREFSYQTILVIKYGVLISTF